MRFVVVFGLLLAAFSASAYAAAGIAGANPFKTGVSAFSLGMAKLMVPMVFVYSPAMLIVLSDYFTWVAFLETTVTCAIGVFMMATAVSAYFLAPMPLQVSIVMGFAAVFMVAPGVTSDMYALVLALPVLVQQVMAYRLEQDSVLKNA